MSHTLPATSEDPALLIILLNIGQTMDEEVGEYSKIAVLNGLVNEILNRLVQRSTKGEIIVPRYRLGLAMYGGEVVDMLGRVESISEVVKRGRPKCSTTLGTNNAAEAFRWAQHLLLEELPIIQRSPAPIVVNITDLSSAHPDVEQIAHEIMNYSTEDGAVLIANVCISGSFPPTEEIRSWPGYGAELKLDDPRLTTLCRMSSPLPLAYQQQIAEHGYSFKGGRHMLIPADADLVSGMLPMPKSTPTISDTPFIPSASQFVPSVTSRQAATTTARRRGLSLRPGEDLFLFGRTYTVQGHPAAPGMTYSVEGGRAIVYKISDSDGVPYCLKMFKNRRRAAYAIAVMNRINLLGAINGLVAARRAVITEHETITHTYPDLTYAVIMPWIHGQTVSDLVNAGFGGTAECVPSVSRDLAIQFLSTMSELERRGMVHTDISSNNVMIDMREESVQLIDLDQMYLPGVEYPSSTLLQTPGYRHPLDQQQNITFADRFGTAILTSEILLLGSREVLRLAKTENIFGQDLGRNTEIFARAESFLRSSCPAFTELFRTAWFSHTSAACPPIMELFAALRVDREKTKARASEAGQPKMTNLSRGTAQRQEHSSDLALDQPKLVFISYAHADSKYFKQLIKHMATLKNQRLVSEWHDQNITAGSEWDAEIRRKLSEAEIILLLVSADFIDSDYCSRTEMRDALARHEAGNARVIPIIVRDSDWKHSSLGKLQALPKRNGQLTPIIGWSNKDAAWLSVVLEIRKALSNQEGD
jgi:serine/threonine protein kinase